MLKKNRLTKNRHFQYIYRKGDVCHSDTMTVVFAKTHIKPFKVGFSVSKKIGKSVVRSKVKRRMKESFLQVMKNFNEGFNYVFVAKPGLENKNFLEIKIEMQYLVNKVNKKLEKK